MDTSYTPEVTEHDSTVVRIPYIHPRNQDNTTMTSQTVTSPTDKAHITSSTDTDHTQRNTVSEPETKTADGLQATPLPGISVNSIADEMKPEDLARMYKYLQTKYKTDTPQFTPDAAMLAAQTADTAALTQVAKSALQGTPDVSKAQPATPNVTPSVVGQAKPDVTSPDGSEQLKEASPASPAASAASAAPPPAPPPALPGIAITSDMTDMKANEIAEMTKHVSDKYNIQVNTPPGGIQPPATSTPDVGHQRSETTFPFPLEVAYKPKVVNHTAAFVRRPQVGTKLEVGYVGCYIDRLTEGRDLPVRAGIPLVTPHNCIVACRTTGYRYAGLQYGYLCFCGNGYGKYDIVPDSECNTVCSGNDTYTCGGLWRNEIFETEAARPTTSAFDINIDMLDQETRKKSVIPVVPDLITENIPTYEEKAAKDSKAGEELLNEIHKYAITDLKALEAETSEAPQTVPQQENLVRKITIPHNMTDDEIINTAATLQASKNTVTNDQVSSSLLEPLSTTFQAEDANTRSPVLLNYYQKKATETESATKKSAMAESDKSNEDVEDVTSYYQTHTVKSQEKEDEAETEPPKQSSSVTPVKIEPGTLLFRGEILLKQLWYDELQNRDSVKFKILSGNIENAVKNIFSGDPSFLKTEVMSLREAGHRNPSRTIADFSLTFFNNQSSLAVTNTILSALGKEEGKLDGMPVYPKSLKVKEYTMNKDVHALIPNLIHPLEGGSLVSDTRSYIAQPDNPYGASVASLLNAPNSSPPSNSVRTHVKPVRVDAQAKLRNYMDTQNPDVNMMIRSVGAEEKLPNEGGKNGGVPYVLRMFFWKDMLARKKREGGEEKSLPDDITNRKKKHFVNASLFDTKPRRSLESSNFQPSGLEKSKTYGGTIITRERRSQADNWPTLFKGDAQKRRNNSVNASHPLTRVKRMPEDEEDAIDAEINSSSATKSFYRDLDSDLGSLFDEPTVANKTINKKRNTLFGKISGDKNYNHDRLNSTETSSKWRRRRRDYRDTTNRRNNSTLT